MTHDSLPTTDSLEESARRHRWNFSVLATYFVVLRVGWVFKLESVIVPMFVTMLGGGPVVLGTLPVLSRLGNSLPQYILSGRIQGAVRLKKMLAIQTFLSAIPWLLLGGISLVPPGWSPAVWLPLFLILYFWFWSLNGMRMLTGGVLQGKLIQARKRGRLFAVSLGVASLLSILILWFVLRYYLQEGLGLANFFGPAFLICGTLFLFGAGCILLLDEPATPGRSRSKRLREVISNSRDLIVCDRHFRRFLFVVALMYMSLLLLPHYAPFGTDRVGAKKDLVIWIIAQNVGTGIGSLVLGFLADRRGNRLTLQVLICWLGLIPLVAVGLSALGPEQGHQLYWIVFFMLGCAPINQRILANYVLELAPAEKHTQYLGTLNLWQLVPLMFSPLFGWLIQVTSHEVMFVFGSMVLLTGAWQAGRLIEPREKGHDS